jgi:hypothetical protein
MIKAVPYGSKPFESSLQALDVLEHSPAIR